MNAKTAFNLRTEREDEQDRLAASHKNVPPARLPSCPPHLLFLCIGTDGDVAGAKEHTA